MRVPFARPGPVSDDPRVADRVIGRRACGLERSDQEIRAQRGGAVATGDRSPSPSGALVDEEGRFAMARRLARSGECGAERRSASGQTRLEVSLRRQDPVRPGLQAGRARADRVGPVEGLGVRTCAVESPLPCVEAGIQLAEHMLPSWRRGGRDVWLLGAAGVGPPPADAARGRHWSGVGLRQPGTLRQPPAGRPRLPRHGCSRRGSAASA